LALRSGEEEYALINNNYNDDSEMNWPSSYLGNYRLVRLVGRGGFASVYLGEHQYLKRLAAIKLLRTVLDEPDRVRFLIEAKLLANLSHPHIVRVLEFAVARRRMVTQNSVTIDNIPFLVMDYVASGSLRTIYPTGTCLSLDTVVAYTKQAAEALQYAHDRHVIHRDIKPENLLLNDQQEVMLSDFGLALFAPRPGFLSQQEMAGTVPYTAPEQLRGKPVFASDQYSLAIVVYEWLCGHIPFQGTDIEIMMSHFSSTPPSLCRQNASIPHAVEEVIMKALAKDPERRYETVQAFAQALEYASVKKRNVFSISPRADKVPALRHSVRKLPLYHYFAEKSISSLERKESFFHSRSLKTRRSLNVLALVAILLFALIIYTVSPLFSHVSSVVVPLELPSTLGVTKAPDGELIGISDGTYIFDTGSSDAVLKEQAAERLRAGDIGSAFSLLSEAHNVDTSDAEALIYQENLRVVNAKYITLVVGATLTGNAASIAIGREDLQGAYIAQREYNDTAEQHDGVKVRLLIANAGSVTNYVPEVAQQFVRLSQKDKTIVGIIDWDMINPAFVAISQLSHALISIASMEVEDSLTGVSKYFFRVSASANMQTVVAAHYVMKTLKAKSAAIFLDPTNDYSRSLSNDFNTNFMSDGGTVTSIETYTVGDATNRPQQLVAELQDALRHHPDVIYFGGYPADVSVLLQHMRPSDPPVMGGNAFYKLGGYPNVSASGLSHLRFTDIAYPDTWDFLHFAQKPAFFMDYPKAFGPGSPGKSVYGYTRADSDTMQAYDAALVLLQASKIALKHLQPLTINTIQQALSEVNGPDAVQGVTGQIAFSADGNPIDKAVTVVCNQGGLFKLDVVEGQFLLNGPLLTNYPTYSNCT
jgi:serine/threonine protein kinase/ABC-type branched-subunit amino acid transport system substrate-binding protein